MFYGKLGEAKASREREMLMAADQVKLTLCLSRIASELAPLISINTQYYINLPNAMCTQNYMNERVEENMYNS